MEQGSLPKQLIRLAYTEIILHHAEVDSASEFIDNLQQDLKAEPNSDSVQREIENTPKASSALEDKTDISTGIDQGTDLAAKSSLIGKFRANKKILILTTALTILILPMLFLLVWSNIHYKNKILPGTTLASIELNSDPQKASTQINDLSSQFKFTLKFNDTEMAYRPEEVGVAFNSSATLEAAKQQSSKIRFFAKPFALFTTRKIENVVGLDQEKLKVFLEAQNYSDKLPEDAKIEYDDSSGQFKITPEVSGRGIDSKSLAKRLQSSAGGLDPAIIDLKIENVTASIKSDDLINTQKEANSYLSQKISIVTPTKTYTPGPSIIKDWLILTPDPERSKYNISLNEKSQTDYISSIVGKVNRKMEKRLYATIDGSEMLLQEGTSGLDVTNVDSAKSQLIDIVKNKKGGSITLVAKEELPSTENIAASGGRWIFADLSQFRIYAYEGSTLVNSFTMSSGKASTPTPTGRYSVMSKVRVKTMTSGGNKNSKDYYSVPNIEWVTYFKAGGYAMHGVYWHNKFGIENTSHGCMGMSNASAQWVYNFIDVGTPVIIVS